MTSPFRSGMSLVEVTISTAIFAVLLTMATAGLTNMRSYVSTAAITSDLDSEARRVVGVIATDLANSAWLIDAGTDLDDLSENSNYDRWGARYYPYVVVQNYENSEYAINGVPDTSGWYAAFARQEDELLQADVILNEKGSIPSDHLEPSQEIIFLRLNYGEEQATPADDTGIWVDFNQTPVPMSDFGDPEKLPEVPYLTLVTNDVGVSDIPLNWETYPGSSPWANDINGDGVVDADPDELREFSYVVVPGPRGGQLQRRYRNGIDGEIITHEEISDDVDRIAIDTYRTDSSLGINQVRIRVWMSRASNSARQPASTRYSEITVALRSTVDPEYSLKLTDWLGSAGGFGL